MKIKKIAYAVVLCKNCNKEGFSNIENLNKSSYKESSGKKTSFISGQVLYILPASKPETKAPKEIWKIISRKNNFIRQEVNLSTLIVVFSFVNFK